MTINEFANLLFGAYVSRATHEDFVTRYAFRIDGDQPFEFYTDSPKVAYQFLWSLYRSGDYYTAVT